MLLLIDNYDSFTFNLVHFLGDVGARSEVWRNDRISVADALSREWEGIVLSPGPCTPNEAGICLDLIAAAAGRLPILGVCLGHQAIGQAFGGRVVRAPVPMHGKLSTVTHAGTDIFAGLPESFQATRYHSLIVAEDSLPECLVPTAWTAAPDGEGRGGRRLMMGMRHRDFPIFGVQFHPESIASECGHRILANFLAIARGANTPASGPLAGGAARAA
jgi:anthranilate synthase/aminodeoxychorismate synthase-like glutamine amidotransferase